jgi:hypothetical protein
MPGGSNWQPVVTSGRHAHDEAMTTAAPPLRLDPDRLLPPEPGVQSIARSPRDPPVPGRGHRLVSGRPREVFKL